MAKMTLNQKSKQQFPAVVENAPTLSLPALFQTTALAPMEKSQGDFSAYLQFVHPLSPAWPKLSAKLPGLAENDIVLVQADPEPPLKLSPLRFILLYNVQFWGHYTADATAELIKATFQKPSDWKDWTETIETGLLVVVDGGLIAARGTFKGPKVHAVHKAANGVASAATGEWGKLSADHAMTLRLPDPRLRLTTTVQLKTKTAKSSGRKYTLAEGIVNPVTAAEVKMMEEFFADPECQEALSLVAEGLKMRTEEIKAKV